METMTATERPAYGSTNPMPWRSYRVVHLIGTACDPEQEWVDDEGFTLVHEWVTDFEEIDEITCAQCEAVLSALTDFVQWAFAGAGHPFTHVTVSAFLAQRPSEEGGQ